MRRAVWRGVCLWLFASVSAFCGQGSNATRVELFVGRGTAPWLPACPFLPDTAQLNEAAQKLGARQRNLDVFGLSAFPREETLASKEPAFRGTQKVTLNQALLTLKVTGINLGRREFLLGARNVFQGDTLELLYQGELFLAEVLEVASTQIVFRDRKRQERGILPHNLVRELVLEPAATRSRQPLDGKVTRMEPIETKRQ